MDKTHGGHRLRYSNRIHRKLYSLFGMILFFASIEEWNEIMISNRRECSASAQNKLLEYH